MSVDIFVNFIKPAFNTYAFNKLPLACVWGVNHAFDDKSNVMCTPDTNKPYVMWIIGRVSRTWFYDKESNPAAQVAINFVPVDNATANWCLRILKQVVSSCYP